MLFRPLTFRRVLSLCLHAILSHPSVARVSRIGEALWLRSNMHRTSEMSPLKYCGDRHAHLLSAISIKDDQSGCSFVQPSEYRHRDIRIRGESAMRQAVCGGRCDLSPFDQ